MKFNIKLLEGEWQKYNEELELLIRPFPNSKQLLRNPNNSNIGEFYWTIFRECVLDWRGATDGEGNTLKCDDINKQKVFDIDDTLFLFVMEKQASIKAQQEVEVKN